MTSVAISIDVPNLAEGVRFFRKTSIYPINHGMVVRREIAEKHPWVVLNLLKAFDKAAAIADAQRMEHADYHLASGAISQEAAKALREPVLRHGIKANRLILETAAQYSLEQGLTPHDALRALVTRPMPPGSPPKCAPQRRASTAGRR